eukprot:6438293-Pyramimonas_sp.AAC.1
MFGCGENSVARGHSNGKPRMIGLTGPQASSVRSPTLSGARVLEPRPALQLASARRPFSWTL